MTQLSEHEASVLAFVQRFPTSRDSTQLVGKLRGEAQKIGRAIIRRAKKP